VERTGISWNPRKWFENDYELTLWCEHPEHWHPVEPSYPLPEAKKWVRNLAPYARRLVQAMKLTLPVIGTGLKAFGDDDKKESIESITSRIDFTEEVFKAIDDMDFKENRGPDMDINGITQASGSMLREFHALLHHLDSSKKWAGLRRVQATTGDWYWVCKDHYRFYDPGLPKLPNS
jgi:hypothetical protein